MKKQDGVVYYYETVITERKIPIVLDEYWGDILKKEDKKSEANDKKQKYGGGKKHTGKTFYNSLEYQNPERILHKKSQTKRINKTLMNLTNRQRFLIEEIKCNKREIEDVAQELHIRPSLVSRQLEVAIRRFKAVFGGAE